MGNDDRRGFASSHHGRSSLARDARAKVRKEPCIQRACIIFWTVGYTVGFLYPWIFITLGSLATHRSLKLVPRVPASITLEARIFLIYESPSAQEGSDFADL